MYEQFSILQILYILMTSCEGEYIIVLTLLLNNRIIHFNDSSR